MSTACKIKSQITDDCKAYLSEKVGKFGVIKDDTFVLDNTLPKEKQLMIATRESRLLNEKYSMPNFKQKATVATVKNVSDTSTSIELEPSLELISVYENALKNQANKNIVEKAYDVQGARNNEDLTLQEKASRLQKELGITGTYSNLLQAQGYFQEKLSELDTTDSFVVMFGANDTLAVRPNNVNATSRQKQVRDTLLSGYQQLEFNRVAQIVMANDMASEYVTGLFKTIGALDVNPIVELMSRENAMAYIKDNMLSSNIDVYNAGALYDNVNNKIIIISNSNDINNQRSDIRRFNDTALKVIHEYVHAATVNYLKNDENSATIAFGNYYAKVYSHVTTSDEFYKLSKEEQQSIRYAISSKEEFIANVFENKYLQDFLRTQKPIRPGFSFTDMWNEVLTLLSKLFKGALQPSLLDEAIQLSTEVIALTRNENKNAQLSNNLTYYRSMGNLLGKFKLMDFDMFGATTVDHQAMISASESVSNLTQEQQTVIDNFMNVNRMFEESINNVTTSLGTESISIENTIIPAIERKYADKAYATIRKELIREWKILAEKGDMVERYKVNKNGVTTYVLRRVTDKQQIIYITSQKKKGNEIKPNEEFDTSVYGDVGTYGHSIMQEYMTFLNTHRLETVLSSPSAPDFNYVGLTPTWDAVNARFESPYDYIKRFDNIYNALEYLAANRPDTLKQDMIDILGSDNNFSNEQRRDMLKVALKIWYDVYVTQYEINQKAGSTVRDTFVPLAEIKTYDEKTDTAGTSDLMIVYSDGSVGFFDYKFSFAGMHRYFTPVGKLGTPLAPTTELEVMTERGPEAFIEGLPQFSDPDARYVFDIANTYRPFYSKVNGYNEQLGDYARYAVENYGATGVVEARIIPFAGQLVSEWDPGAQEYNTVGKVQVLAVSDVYPKANKSLLPIATNVEQTTDKLLNEFLNEVRNNLPTLIVNMKELSEEYNLLDFEGVDKLREALSKIKANKDLSTMLYSVEALSEHVLAIDNYYAQVLALPNPKIKSSHFEAINAYSKMITLYGDLSKGLAYIEHYNKLTSRDGEQVQFKQAVNTLLNSLKVLADKIKILEDKMVIAKFNEEKVFVDEDSYLRHTYEFRDLNAAEKWTSRFANLRIPSMELFKKILDKQVFLPERKAIADAANEFEALRVDYEKWAKAKGLNGTNMYEPLINKAYNKNDIELIGEYDVNVWDKMFYDYYIEKNDLNKEVMATKIHNEVENNDRYYDRHAQLVKYKDDLDRDPNATPLMKERADKRLKDFVQKYSVTGSFNLTLTHKYYLKPKPTFAFKYAEPKFTELMKPENKAALNMLNYFYEMNSRIMKVSGTHARKMYKTQIPNVMKSYIETNEAHIKANMAITSGTTVAAIATGGFTGLGVGLALGGTAISAYNEFRNYYAMKKINSAEALPRYMRHLLQSTFVRDNQNASGINNRNNMGNLLDIKYDSLEIPMTFIDPIDNADVYKSRDLGISYLLMLQAAHMHNGRKKVKGIGHAIVRHIEDSTFMQDDSLAGKAGTKFDEMLGIKNDKNNANYVELANTLLLEHVYGMNKLDKEYIIGELDGNKISANKLAATLVNKFSVLQLAGNYVSAFGGGMAARLQVNAEASKGLHFTRSQLSTVSALINKFDTKTLLGEMYFDIMQESMSAERISKSSIISVKRTLTKYGGQAPQMFLQYITDNRGNKDVLDAMMHNYGIIVHKDRVYVKPLSQLKTMFEPILGKDVTDNLKSIHEAMYVPSDFDIKKSMSKLNEDAYSIIELKDSLGNDLTEDHQDTAYTNFRNIVRTVIGSTRGFQPAEEKAMYDKYILGKMLGTFRGWGPAMARERFGAQAFNTATKQLEAGRYNLAFVRAFNSDQSYAKSVLKASMALAIEIASFNVIDGMKKFRNENETTVNHYYETWKIKNPGNYKQLLDEFMNDDKLAFEEYKKMRIRQLGAFTSEIRIYIMLVGAILGMAALGFDDEEESNYFLTQIYKITDRAKLETAYFANPYEFVNLLTKAPIPSFGFTKTILDLTMNTFGEGKDMTIGLIIDGPTASMLSREYNMIYNDDYEIDPGSSEDDGTPILSNTVRLMPGASGFLRSADVTNEDGGILNALGLFDNKDPDGLTNKK